MVKPKKQSQALKMQSLKENYIIQMVFIILDKFAIEKDMDRVLIMILKIKK